MLDLTKHRAFNTLVFSKHTADILASLVQERNLDLLLYFLVGLGTLLTSLQGDLLNTVVFVWHLGKSDLSSVRVYLSVHWTSHFLQGTRQTRQCLSGQVVVKLNLGYSPYI